MMCPCDLRHDGQTKSSARASFTLATPEAIEHVGSVHDRNSSASIGDRNRAVLRYRDRHLCTNGAMAYGILYHIPHCVRDSVGIAMDRHDAFWSLETKTA